MFIRQPFFFDHFKATLSYQKFEESRVTRKFNDVKENNRLESVDVYAVNLDFDQSLSSNYKLYYGFESVYNSIGSIGFSDVSGVESPISTRYPDDSRYFSNAIYANLDQRISSHQTLVYGARYNFIGIDASLDTNFYKSSSTSNINQQTSAFTASVGTAFYPSPSWQLNGNVSSGFSHQTLMIWPRYLIHNPDW